MANIFKANEIYKKTPKKVNPSKPIIPLRGLYVAGKYRPPYWIDHVLSVNQITTTKATVLRYTESEQSLNDFGCISLIDFDMDITNFEYEKYSQSNVSTYDDYGCISLIDFDMDATDFNYMKYQSNSYSVYDDYGCISLIDFDMHAPSADLYTKISIINNEQPPGQPVLNIKSFTTTPGTIT